MYTSYDDVEGEKEEVMKEKNLSHKYVLNIFFFFSIYFLLCLGL